MARHVAARTALQSVTRIVGGAVAAILAVLACCVGFLSAIAATSLPAHAADSAQFRPVPLPPDVGYLNAIVCPTTQECFVAGQTADANQRGLILHLANGAWQPTVIPSAAYLIGLSCVDATHCTAVGVTSDPTRAGAGVIVDTADGSTWQVPAQPSSTPGAPAIPLDSVSCAGSFCMAVGGELPASSGSPASQVLVTYGQGWSAATVPVEPGATGTYLAAVDCTAPSDCWVVGQAVWHTSDGGATWVVHNPPNGGSTGGITAPYYSLLSALAFTDPLHGIVAGGDQCGGDTDHCGGVLFNTANGGVTWTRTSNSDTPFVDALTCRSGLSACIAVSETFTPIAPGGATANVTDGSVVLTSTTGSAWPVTQRLEPDSLTAVACPTATNCLAVGGNQPHNIGAVLTEVPLPVAPANLSVVATSIPAPADAFSGVGRAVINTSITLVAMLALTFPSQLFNRTFEENYDEILAITKRRFGRRTGPGAHEAATRAHEVAAPAHESGAPAPAHEAAAPRRRHDLGVFGVVVLLGSLIGSLRDPGFGANTASVLMFVATGLTLLVTVGAGYASGRSYRARVHATVAAHLEALPAGLIVATLCVAVSRIAHFEPGYLYGVVCGAVFAGALKRREAGQLTIVSSVVMLAVSVIAWFGWVPVSHAATHHGAFLGVILLDDLLASVFVAGITGTVISLLPLRFMPGHALYVWHRGAWALTFGVATFGLVEVLLRPSAQAATHPGSIAWTTAAALFVLFGVGSLAFREYFARHVPLDQRRVALGAAVIAKLRAEGGRSEHELAELLSVEARHLHSAIDRLERAGWLRSDNTPQAIDADAPLHLSSAANGLHEGRRVGGFTRQRLRFGLTQAERRALAGVLQVPISPAARAGSDARAAGSDRSPTTGS